MIKAYIELRRYGPKCSIRRCGGVVIEEDISGSHIMNLPITVVYTASGRLDSHTRVDIDAISAEISKCGNFGSTKFYSMEPYQLQQPSVQLVPGEVYEVALTLRGVVQPRLPVHLGPQSDVTIRLGRFHVLHYSRSFPQERRLVSVSREGSS